MLRDGGFDFVGLGECEGAMVELAERLEAGGDPSDIANLAFLRDGALVANALRPRVDDLDKLPWPDRELWERAGFDFRELMVMGARGCWFRCDFCMNSYNLALYGEEKSSIRRRSPENVVAEIKAARARYGTRFVFFYDDDLTSDGPWLESFAELYARELRLPFYCHGTNNTLDARKAKILKDAGCRQLFMGIDSGSPALRADVLNRHFTNEDVAEKARIVRAAGIDLQVSAIFGIPGETRAEMRETVEFVASIRPAVTATYVCYPFPGTPILEAAREAGILDAGAEARMRAGEGSLHSESILRHPLAPVAYACMNLLPAYTKAPAALRPLLMRLMMRGGPSALARLVFLLAIPLTSPLFGLTRLRALLGQVRRTAAEALAERVG
ncbi:MAG: B12-binding domain-containing radical SAM protein, partial [Candidatus Methylomirabilis sp.]|nr:B12-binding domain-containing radical SAM protein [Deltaproteobacteria bacterium]